ncbi:hypothetical protein [Nitratifractor salsuginis]|uniref:Terminase small subunit n=1 Tax=Nitratifractor salsuginis (strain DSM 16511 / JCM 12458 / E9I37-1) TaxID=749222 RepID=E6WY58_NITSE|nr:hypothetical protein [Nitratifractor salsuginis]ADV46432.1 hypothetical protein Nitsa_1179 [Nitratifractor salsuginis DSM 16511]
MPKTPPAKNYLTKMEIRYLHRFAELMDERKALREVFGPYTPRKRHDEIMAKPLAQKKLKEIVDNGIADMENAAYSAMKKLVNIQNTNIADILDLQTGQIREDIDPAYADAIKSIKYDPETGAVVQVTLADKLKAVETTLKFAGKLNKKVDMNVNVSITDQLRNAEIPDEEVDGFIKQMLGAPDDAIEAEVEEGGDESK